MSCTRPFFKTLFSLKEPFITNRSNAGINLGFWAGGILGGSIYMQKQSNPYGFDAGDCIGLPMYTIMGAAGGGIFTGFIFVATCITIPVTTLLGLDLLRLRLKRGY
jgi:hypothetical protein